MATLSVSMDTKKVLFGTQMKRIQKGIEHLYYLLLFSTAPAYSKSADPWHLWYHQGTEQVVRVPPPGARQPDRYLDSLRYEARALHITALSSNKDTFAKLDTVLAEIDNLRLSLAGKPDADKLKDLLSSKRIAETLVAPVTEVIKRNGLPVEQGDTFLELMNKALLFLSDSDVVAVKRSLNGS